MGKVNAIRRAFRPASVCVLLAGAAACASPPPPFPELPRLSVSTQLGSRHLCGTGVSPPITIVNAPAATAQYRLRMTNMDVLFQDAWQTTVAADSKAGFAEGAIADYTAPCVGELRFYAFYPYQQHRLEVLALDAQSRPLAYGQTIFLVEALSTAADRERATRRPGTAATTVPVPQAPMIIGPAVTRDDYNTIGPQISPMLVPQIQGPMPQP